MKTTLALVLFVLFLTSCDLLDFGEKSNSSDSIGGSTDIPINTVGNTFSNYVSVGGTN